MIAVIFSKILQTRKKCITCFPDDFLGQAVAFLFQWSLEQNNTSMFLLCSKKHAMHFFKGQRPFSPPTRPEEGCRLSQRGFEKIVAKFSKSAGGDAHLRSRHNHIARYEKAVGFFIFLFPQRLMVIPSLHYAWLWRSEFQVNFILHIQRGEQGGETRLECFSCNRKLPMHQVAQKF